MKIEFDPTLVEQAVVHRVYGDRKLEAKLHRKIDRLYELPEGRERDSKFVAAYGESFVELNLARPLTALLDELPTITEHVARCLIRESPRAKRDKAELLVKRGTDEPTPEDRRLIIEVSVAGLLDPSVLEMRMRREFLHVVDMLDDDFAYEREEIDGLASRQNLVRDRYRVLWDIYIEGRLKRQGRGDTANADRLAQMLDRVFGLEESRAGSELFDRIYHADRLTHTQLFRWSQSPEFSRELGNGVDAQRRPGSGGEPGAVCPICGFPTFDWSDDANGLPAVALQSIGQEIPDWSPDHGACRQCIEIYMSMNDESRRRIGT